MQDACRNTNFVVSPAPKCPHIQSRVGERSNNVQASAWTDLRAQPADAPLTRLRIFARRALTATNPQERESQTISYLDGLSAEDRNRYIESWRNYKLFRNTTFLSSVVLVFFGVLASKIGQTSVWPLLTILALALTIVSGLATELWKCPRCGNTFSGAKRQP